MGRTGPAAERSRWAGRADDLVSWAGGTGGDSGPQVLPSGDSDHRPGRSPGPDPQLGWPDDQGPQGGRSVDSDRRTDRSRESDPQFGPPDDPSPLGARLGERDPWAGGPGPYVPADPYAPSGPYVPSDPWLDPGPLNGTQGTRAGRRSRNSPRQGDPPSHHGPPDHHQHPQHGHPSEPRTPYGAPPAAYGSLPEPRAPYDVAPEPPSPYAQHPAYGYDPYQDNPYEYGGQPPKRNNRLIVALSVGLGVILLAGGTIGALNYLDSAASRPKVALPSGITTAPLQSDPPTTKPTEPAARPTSSPSESSRPVPGSPIGDTEFGDWSFSLRGLRFEANKVGGWTYDTCDPVDGEGVLAKTKCERAVQVAYSAYRGHLKAVRVIMAFPTDKAANSAVARLKKLTSNAVNIRRDMIHETYAYGQIRANVTKNYVIATIVTADRTAKPKAEKFHLYMQADAMGYLLLRDVTITT